MKMAVFDFSSVETDRTIAYLEKMVTDNQRFLCQIVVTMR